MIMNVKSLRGFRNELGVTKTVLAKALGVSGRYYNQLENGERDIKSLIIEIEYENQSPSELNKCLKAINYGN